MDFSEFLDQIGAQDFTKFVTLYHPDGTLSRQHLSAAAQLKERVTDITNPQRRENRQRLRAEASEQVKNWIAEVRASAGGSGFYYLILEEYGPGNFTFHLLLKGCDWSEAEFTHDLRARWRETTHGYASERQVRDDVRGLIRHLVFKSHCVVETNEGVRYVERDFDK